MYAANTTVWQFSTCPVIPACCRAMPTVRVPLLQLRGLIQHHDRLRITQVREGEPLQRG